MEALRRSATATLGAGGPAGTVTRREAHRRMCTAVAQRRDGGASRKAQTTAPKSQQPRRGAHRKQRQPWEAPPDDFLPPSAPLDDPRHGLLRDPLSKLDGVYENCYDLVNSFVRTAEEAEARFKGRETGALGATGVAERVQVQKFFGMPLDWDTVPTSRLERDLELLDIPAVYPLDFMNFKEGQEDLTPPHLRTDRGDQAPPDEPGPEPGS